MADSTIEFQPAWLTLLNWFYYRDFFNQESYIQHCQSDRKYHVKLSNKKLHFQFGSMIYVK